MKTVTICQLTLATILLLVASFAIAAEPEAPPAMGATATSSLQQFPTAVTREGYEALQRKDYDTAVHKLLPAADSGDPFAQQAMGALYFEGHGVQLDTKRAIHYLQLAAQAGLSDSQFVLGGIYFLGNIVPANQTLGLQWMQKAADQGHQGAKSTLSEIASNSGTPSASNQSTSPFWEEVIKRASNPSEEQAISDTLGFIESDILAMMNTPAFGVACPDTKFGGGYLHAISQSILQMELYG